MPFDPNEATRPKVPMLRTGGRLNDAFKVKILEITDDVTLTNDKGIAETFIILRVEVLAARGGDKDENDQIIDTPAGAERAVWLRYKPNAAPLTTACAQALKAVSATTRFAVGGTLSFIHDRLGDRPTNSAHNRAKLYTAKYEPPDPMATVAANLPNDFPAATPTPAAPDPFGDDFLDR